MAAGGINKWLGGVSTTETNASVAGNWSLGTAPVAGETLIFGDSAGDSGDGTKWDALNWDTLGPLDYVDFFVTSDFDGDIGATGTYAEFNVGYNGTLGKIIIEGSGNLYLTMHTANARVAGELLIMKGSGNLYLKSDDGTAGSSTNDFGKVWATSGTLTLHDNVVLNSLDVSGGAIVYGGDLNEDASGNDVDVRVFGGSCYWDSQLSAATLVTAGSLYWGGTTSAGTLNGASNSGVNRVCDALEVWNTGKFYWRIQHTTLSDKSQVKIFKLYNGGEIDVAQQIGAGGDKQIGSGASEISEMWFDTIGRFNNGIGNITFGSGSSVKQYGGTLHTPTDESISW